VEAGAWRKLSAYLLGAGTGLTSAALTLQLCSFWHSRLSLDNMGIACLLLPSLMYPDGRPGLNQIGAKLSGGVLEARLAEQFRNLLRGDRIMRVAAMARHPPLPNSSFFIHNENHFQLSKKQVEHDPLKQGFVVPTRPIGGVRRPNMNTTMEAIRAELLKLSKSQGCSLTYRRTLMKLLRQAVPFDASCSTTVDPGTLLSTGAVTDEEVEHIHDRLFEYDYIRSDYIPYHELVLSGDSTATLSRATEGRPARSALYRNVLSPAGFRDELRAALMYKGACWGFLTLFRRCGRPFFTEEERLFIASLVPASGNYSPASGLDDAPVPARRSPVLHRSVSLGQESNEGSCHRRNLNLLQ